MRCFSSASSGEQGIATMLQDMINRTAYMAHGYCAGRRSIPGGPARRGGSHFRERSLDLPKERALGASSETSPFALQVQTTCAEALTSASK